VTSHVFTAHLRFRGSYFRGTQPICEKREILHHAKISLYTVVDQEQGTGDNWDGGGALDITFATMINSIQNLKP
jgi:hypothetical protein